MSLDFSQIDFSLNAVSPDRPFALAVSGGADSMALLQLFALWRRVHPLDGGCQDLVLSVDHGLRAEAASEVAFVVEEATRLGFAAQGLALSSLTEGPGLQARARQARYEVMADVMQANGIGVLVTAHTLDDQVETFLMRLQRGSGLEGLAAMRSVRPFADGEVLLRPLLGFQKRDLKAYLAAQGLRWFEDPSNEDEIYERVGVRKLVRALDEKGRFSQQVGVSVRRLGMAQQVVDQEVVRFFEQHVQVHSTGWVEFEAAAFQAALPLVQVGVVQWVLRRFGRNAGFAKVERALSALEGLGTGRFVLAGVVFSSDGHDQIVCWREVGRAPLEVIQCASDLGCLLWDQRVRLVFDGLDEQMLVVRALTAEEGGLVRAAFDREAVDLPFPSEVLLSLATVWTDEPVPRLVRVPQITDEGVEGLIVSALSGLVLPEGRIEAQALRLFPDELGASVTDL